MRMIKTGAAAAALGLMATTAMAATVHDVTISSVTGEWVSAGPSNAYDLSIDTDDESTQVLWGQPKPGGPQSGYVFEGLIPPPVATTPDTDFELGLFTHLNNPIKTDPGGGKVTGITEADLRIDFVIQIGDMSHAFSQLYTFEHDETKNEGENSAGDCKHGGQNGDAGLNSSGCADRVTITQNSDQSESVVVDGYQYDFEISGFRVDGETLDFFLTEEDTSNEAVLVGSYSVSAVPLPAAGWMLLAGIGGLVAAKRRKSRAKA